MADVLSILSANYKTVGLAVPIQDAVCGGRSHALSGQLDRKIRRQQVVQDHGLERHGVSRQGPIPERQHQQICQEVLIKDNAFRIGDTKFMVTKVGTAVIKNVVTDPATGGTMLDTSLCDATALTAGVFNIEFS